MSVAPSALARLVPMLGSNYDGEVVAAARAIERKLKSNERDWHWIAQQVENADVVGGIVANAYQPKPTAAPSPAPNAYPEYRPRKPREPSWDGISHHSRIAWTDAFELLDWLTEADRVIVRNIRRNLHVGMMIDIGRHLMQTPTRLIKRAKTLGLTP